MKELNEIKYEKPIGRFFMYIFILTPGILMFFFSIMDAVEQNSFTSDTAMFIITSSFFLFLSIGNLLSYFGNKIIISESCIIIKRLALGKTYIVSQNCIIAKRTVDISSRGIDNYKIILYLINGKKIITGKLDCKTKEFDKINKEFKFPEITYSKSYTELRNNFKDIKLNSDDFLIKTNYFSPFLTFSPLILIILIILIMNI